MVVADEHELRRLRATKLGKQARPNMAEQCLVLAVINGADAKHEILRPHARQSRTQGQTFSLRERAGAKPNRKDLGVDINS